MASSIDIRDSDTRPLALTVGGIDDSAVISVALCPKGYSPGDDEFVTVEWSDDTQTSVDLPLGEVGGFDLSTLGLGLFYPVVRVVDGTNIRHFAGSDPISIVNVAP